tara:strand:- start:10019 stop:10225 length:207 start_codon:yes stop_codon:yes gene_type:complete
LFTGTSRPIKVNVDKSGSNKSALSTLNNQLRGDCKIEIRQSKYLNNGVEQDHRFIKNIIKPMLGFKSF